jgi:threonine/homoserine/homoserine lactone efflux protein
MDWTLFPRGVLIGFSVAIPVGPMAVLCIRRTIAFGRLTGLISGAGIASADAIYGAVAAFGLTTVSTFLVDIQDLVRIVGGAFLCYLGYRTLSSRAAEVNGEVDSGGPAHAAAYLSTLGLTLTNPATILSFAAIFSGFGVAASGTGSGSASALVAGVFLGSSLWWLLLTSGTSLLRGWLSTARLTWLNRMSGAAILIFGILAVVSGLK